MMVFRDMKWCAYSLIAFLLAGMGLWLCSREEVAPLPPPLGAEAGDVVLLEGGSLRSRVVRWRNRKTEFSHVGILEPTPSGLFVLHAAPKKGCVREGWGDLMRDGRFRKARMLRAPGIGADAVARMMAFCAAAVEAGRPFDHFFRYGAGEGYYCTEFVLKGYEAAGIALLENLETGARLLPEELCRSKKLNEAPEF